MPEQSAADAAPLAARQDVSVTNEIDVAHRLEAHHACQLAVLLIAPERDTGGDLASELVPRHVGLVPPIGRDHTTIGLSGGVDDREDGRAIVVMAGAEVLADETNRRLRRRPVEWQRARSALVWKRNCGGFKRSGDRSPVTPRCCHRTAGQRRVSYGSGRRSPPEPRHRQETGLRSGAAGQDALCVGGDRRAALSLLRGQIRARAENGLRPTMLPAR